MPRRDIYVEILIRGKIDELWRSTQTPHMHEQWDLRFTEIRYLPRPNPAQPQQFLYATRIGVGLRIEGAGESVGTHEADGSRTSALKFWSDDRKSLIREGSGYWKYVPSEAGAEDAGGGVRFLTRYDYRTRFGVAGALLDRFIFRPLLGWATAWSFDRLRLWIERGIHPAISMQRSLLHAIVRVTLALLWIYQGLVPKLLFVERSGEIETVRAMGLFEGRERELLMIAGLGEIAVGMALLLLWRWRWLLLANVFVMALLAVTVAIGRPELYAREFNPATLNLAMAALGLLGWIAQHDLPSARNCVRRPSAPAAGARTEEAA